MVHKIVQLIFVTVIFFSQITAHAQKIQLIRPYIGDTVPKIVPLNMMDHEARTFRLKDFRGKWLILDFWASYCQPCINAMPDLYEIQREFKDELNIILVTHESADRVKALLRKSTVINGVDLPFAVEDTLLRKLFPHQFIPHEVWIDPYGVVRAITDHLAVTSEHVKGMISGKISSLPEKRDVLVERESDSGGKVLFETVLSRVEDVNSGKYGIRRDSSSGKHWYERNVYACYSRGAAPLQLFYRTYTMLVEGFGNGNVNPKRIDFEIRDSLLFNRHAKILVENGRVTPHSSQFPYLYWKDKYEYAKEMRYDYDYKLPFALPDSQFCRLVLEDLNRYFSIKARVELRRKPSWILKADESTKDQLLSAGGKWRAIVSADSISLHNLPFSQLFRLLCGFKNTPPIVDETGINESTLVDIGLHLSDFPGYDSRQGAITNNPLHFETARRELQKYGLDLVKGERMVPMLVVYDE